MEVEERKGNVPVWHGTRKPIRSGSAQVGAHISGIVLQTKIRKIQTSRRTVPQVENCSAHALAGEFAANYVSAE